MSGRRGLRWGRSVWSTEDGSQGGGLGGEVCTGVGVGGRWKVATAGGLQNRAGDETGGLDLERLRER